MFSPLVAGDDICIVHLQNHLISIFSIMATSFHAPAREELMPKGQLIYDNIHAAYGKVPNLFAFVGYSANGLESYLALQQAQAKGTFNAKERESVYLAVSEVNGCRYCQSAHTAIGKMNGFTDDEILQLRQGYHANPRLNAMVALAKEITETKGRPAQAALDQFFAQGFGNAALVDLVLLVADKIVANYLHNISQIEIDWPLAPVLETEAVG